MYIFSSLLGLWLLTPYDIQNIIGPVYPHAFSIEQGIQTKRNWWLEKGPPFKASEYYFIEGNSVTVSDAAGSTTWDGKVADYNVDGFCNAIDLDAFTSAFELGVPWADFDANGFVNGDDFDKFMDEFIKGC